MVALNPAAWNRRAELGGTAVTRVMHAARTDVRLERRKHGGPGLG